MAIENAHPQAGLPIQQHTTSPLECSSRRKEDQNELVLGQSVNQSLVRSLSASYKPVLTLPRQKTSAAVNDTVSQQLSEHPMEDDQASCDFLNGDMDLDPPEQDPLQNPLHPPPFAPVNGERNTKLPAAATTDERMSAQETWLPGDHSELVVGSQPVHQSLTRQPLSHSYSSSPHVMQQRAKLSLPTATRHPSTANDQASPTPSEGTRPPVSQPVECSGQRAGQEDRIELVMSLSHTQVLSLTGQKPSADSGQVMVPTASSMSPSHSTLHSQHSQLPLLPAVQGDEASALSSQLQTEGMVSRDLESSWELLDKSDGEVVPVGECSQEWAVKRKELYTIFCAHKEDKSIKLGIMALKVANCSKPYPKLQMRLYPCGEGDDRDNHYVTLGVEFHQHRGRFKDVRVKLSATVEELPGQRELGSAQVTAEANGQNFYLLGLVSHMAIIVSRSSHLMVRVTAVMEHLHPGLLPVPAGEQ